MLKPIITKRGKSIIIFILTLTFVFFYIDELTDYCLAEDTWKEVQDVTFKGEITFSKPLTGIYNHGKFNYDDAHDVKITAIGNLFDNKGTIIKNFNNLPGILVHGKEYDYFQFDIDQWRVQIHSQMENLEEKIIKKVFIRSNIPSQNKTQQNNTNSIIPAFKSPLKGSNEVRVKNPNNFQVTVGLRSGNQGKDFRVADNGVSSIFVPNGSYEIYFVYSSKPDALFKGDDFSLNNNGIEIQIVRVVEGNYGIRRVK